MVNIKIEKRHLYLISAILVFLIGAGLTIAWTAGTAPNPGHDLSSISAPAGCLAGQYIRINSAGGGWQCNNPPSLSCTTVWSSGPAYAVSGNYENSASCDVNYQITGGGCEQAGVGSIVQAYVATNDGAYHCRGTKSTITAQAICCRIV